MVVVAWQCHGAAAATGSAGKDGASAAKRGHVQSMGQMGREMETGEEAATFCSESRPQVAKYADCAGVSGAQGVGQGAQEPEEPIHADIEAMDAWGNRSCVVDLV